LKKALQRWGELPLAVRRDLAWACLESEVGARALLADVEEKRIPSVEIEPTLADTLRRHSNASLSELATKVLPRPPSNRGAVVAQFRKALDQSGDARRGKEVFAKHCRTCHIFRGDGGRVGPDLSGIRGRSGEAILSDILDPNREVSGDYTAVVASLKSGRLATGILAGETAAHIALIGADGTRESIRREDLEAFRSTGKSLMPEGFERNLTPGDVADLLAFLQGSATN
jgi:putative heme-binding domain-containing protein